MAKNEKPIFTKEPLLGMGQVNVANPNRDGTGTLVTIVTGVVDSTRIDLVRIAATVTTTAGMIRLFLYAGATNYLIKEIPVSALTVGVAIPAFSAEWVPTEPIILPDTSWQLKASTENAEAINVFAFGGHFTA